MDTPKSTLNPPPHHIHRSFLQRHSLSLTVLGFVVLWTVLYQYGNPNTHRGAFYGNAIADWTGTFLILLVTKFLHEQGSTESRPFEDRATTPFTRFLVCHSLSLFLAACCVGTGVWFLSSDPNSKWGAVAGNLLSQFVQLLGLVLLTKKLFESVPRGKKTTSPHPAIRPTSPIPPVR